MRFGALRRYCNARGKAFQGFLKPVQGNQRTAFVDVKLDDPRRDSERFVIAGNCRVGTPQPHMKAAAFVQSVGIVGLRREDNFIGGQCLLIATETLERSGAIFESVEIVCMIGERILKTCKRLLMAGQRGEDKSVIVQYLGRSWRSLEHGTDEPERLGILSLLMAQQTEEMQGIEVLGIRGEDCTADGLGVREPALLIMRKGLHDGVLRWRQKARLRLCRPHPCLAGRRLASISS